ncbi:MAG: hypothetical protein U0K57_02750 [Lachnospiraceae bacterium]|nr:hypothetical protein [Lachnospiraceae bacterium]
MEIIDQKIEYYKKKIEACTSMTNLLLAMASWQSFEESQALTPEQKKPVEDAYIKAEQSLIGNVKGSIW